MIIPVLLALGCIVYFYPHWKKYRRMVELSSKTPSFGGWPVIHNLFMFNGDFEQLWDTLAKLMDIANTVGGVLALWIGSRLVYFITDPDDAQTVLEKCLQKNRAIHDWGNNYVGHCLVSEYVTKWKRSHSVFSQTFLKNLHLYQKDFNSYARSLLRSLEPLAGKGDVDVHPEVSQAIFQAVRSTVVGNSKIYEDILDDEYKAAQDSVLEVLAERLCNVFLHVDIIYKFTELKKTEERLVDIVHKKMDMMISLRKKERQREEQNEENHSAGEGLKSFIDILMDLSVNDQEFTDEHMRNELNGLIIEHNTLATSLLFAMIVLGSYPEIQDKVYDEVLAVVGSDREINDYYVLTYLDAFINELHRLYPPISVVSRSIDEEIELKKHQLPAGSSVVIGLHGINRSSAWGVDADTFRPERWLEPDSLPKSPGALSTFSLGPRNCPAKPYALMLLKIFIVHVVRRFRMKSDIHQMKLKYLTTIKPVSKSYISLELR